MSPRTTVAQPRLPHPPPLLCALLLVAMATCAPTACSASPLSVLSSSPPPFASVSHPSAPSDFFGPRFRAARSGPLGAATVAAHSAQTQALPTGRWWQNAVLAAGDQPIVSYPHSVRLSSTGSPLHAEARAAQTTSSRPGSPLDVTATGLYASLPVREENELQVILPWRPDLLITNALYDAAATVTSSSSSSVNDTNSNAASASSEQSIFQSPLGVEEAPIDAARHTVEMEPHQIVDEDMLSVRVQWKQSNGGGRMLFPLVRGSPYLTGVYSGLCPALYTGHAILSVNDADVPSSESGRSESCTVLNRHHIVLNSGTTIMVYLDQKACVVWDRNRVVFSNPNVACHESNWVVRVAMLPSLDLPVLRNRVGILDAFRANIPISGSVSFARDGAAADGEQTSTMRMYWRSVDISRQSLQIAVPAPASAATSNSAEHSHSSSSSSSSSSAASAPTAAVDHGDFRIVARSSSLPDQGLLPCELLLMTLPHQQSLLKNHVGVGLEFDSIKGTMKAAVGNEWLLHLRHAAVSSSFEATTAPLSAADPEWIEVLRSSLAQDAQLNISAEVTDPYGFGKHIARQARLVLIADELATEDSKRIARSLRARMRAALTPWFLGSNSDPLMYDSTWGGIVPSAGLKDRNADYGSGFYSDHHFHWGYFLCAAAALAKSEETMDREWIETYNEHILALARDIANPALAVGRDTGRGLDALSSQGGAEASDVFFPSFRHMDLFDGHSWANGMFASADGRNSESSSEAVNAYYSLALLGRALGSASMQYLGEVLTAIEVHGVKHYWHMDSRRSHYGSGAFSAGKCVGMVWSDKAVQETWFAVGRSYVHLINVLPITPVSEHLLSPEWIKEAYPVLLASLPHARPLMDDSWLAFAHAELAVLDPQQAWDKMRSLSTFDGGASRTNFLYWVATRPRQ